MPKLQSNNITIAYEINGAGHPLVLITGVGYGKWFWRKVVPGLAQHFQVVLAQGSSGLGTAFPGHYVRQSRRGR
ncbi:MAG: hypothetical protein HY782_16020 [Chloroflexi bacterium]|nr:hypothetical protein [Chloroflexota bacterium]